MIKRCLEIFNQISAIPHPSGDTERLKKYICDFAKNLACEIKTDTAGNIYLKKGKPNLCLQAHYDMVLAGDVAALNLIKKDNFLMAKDSSLGADNGIGIALSLMFLEQEENLECLFTNDEEIGLLGARDLKLRIESKNLLNLDSEFFGSIVVGCAGGYVLKNKFLLKLDKVSYSYSYQIQSRGYKGGHSGLDIAHNPKNPIQDLFLKLKDKDYGIFSLNAGEFSNSIPINLKMQIKANTILSSDESFEILPIDDLPFCYKKNQLEQYILGLNIGVQNKNHQNQVIQSLNLAKITQLQDAFEVILMGRANYKELLEKSLKREQDSYILYGKDSVVEEFYPPWEEEQGGVLLDFIKKSFAYRASIVETIHAGLECGILKERLLLMGLEDLEIVSLGPSIFNPHSKKEKLDLVSLEEFCKVLSCVVRELC